MKTQKAKEVRGRKKTHWKEGWKCVEADMQKGRREREKARRKSEGRNGMY